MITIREDEALSLFNYSPGHFPFDFVSEIQRYVRPTVNPKLTEFCKTLTAITQSQVDNGDELKETLKHFDDWLKKNGLIEGDILCQGDINNSISSSSSSSGSCSSSSSGSVSNRSGSSSFCTNVTHINNCDKSMTSNLSMTSNGSKTNSTCPTFCIITWGDSDIGTILKEQCKRLKIDLPFYFHQWINLKSLFRQHFGWEPHGGLQSVVERCGYSFDGRAHSGLVDSRNTAKIVKKMLEEGFRFTRPTRNIHAYAPR